MKESKEGTTVRQNSTYTSTHKQEVNLRRNPTLHFQIGLILALIAAIFFIEMRMPEKAHVVPFTEIDADDVFTIGEVKVEPKEKLVIRKKISIPEEPKSTFIDNVQKKDDKDDLEESIFKSSEPEDKAPLVDPGTPAYDDFDDEVPVAVAFVEQVPLFPGCEGLNTNDERRACMSTKISKFVSRKFRSERGEGLGLEGENQIYVVFKIDKDGNVVEVKAKAPHEKLEKEAIRVTELLPKMTPGKQQGQSVNVTMALPIKFIIED